jgi:signal transduction histidine kinase
MSNVAWMTDADTPPPVTRAWPLLLALGGVVLLLTAMLGVDLVVARRVAHKTAEIVGNSQRSVELVDDLREQSHRLLDPEHAGVDLATTAERIREDAQAYDPLANFHDEREEWNRLRGLLGELQASIDRKQPQQIGALGKRIGASIDRLVQINRESAHAQAEAIADVHWKAIVADASVGLLAILLVLTIVVVTLRTLARQRALTERYIGLLSERNRELDAFAARAAHDLRAPLNPIRGYADLMLTDGVTEPEEIRGMASRIRLGVDRMTRVVDDMLELSRAGRPTPGRASPARVTAEVLEELEADLRGAEVTTVLTDDPVACAPGVLAQIVRNLVGNAVKFRSRQRKLTVKLDARAHDGVVELVIEDNGMGMDAESAAHAFEPYYRGKAREVPGHGLGLAIVERTARALGGSCELSSAPDQGTRITLRLPRA